MKEELGGGLASGAQGNDGVLVGPVRRQTRRIRDANRFSLEYNLEKGIVSCSLFYPAPRLDPVRANPVPPHVHDLPISKCTYLSA